MKVLSTLATAIFFFVCTATANAYHHFDHFVAQNSTRTCTAGELDRPFNHQIRGVNLGGWMVLEPWITPSLFYQFLGGDQNTTALDTHSFCEVLGPEEANKQLRRHWETWVTEEIISDLAASGAVNSLRLPVGDFMYTPYGPYGMSLCGI
jgi:glucan 1,3-beta-glucosidase